MKKLLKYIKPYRFYIAAMLFLLILQASVDLSLPNLMSDIVNTGIQRAGITDSAPQLISAGQLELLSAFAPPEDREILDSFYAPADMSDISLQDRERFFNISDAEKNADILCLRALSENEKEQLQLAFGRACSTASGIIGSSSKSSGENGGEDSSAVPNLLSELEKIKSDVSAEELSAARTAALAESGIQLEQTAGEYIKEIYLSLGADLGGMQMKYILTTGGKMLILTLLLVMCAVSVGFCASRLGTGVARDMRHDVFVKITGFTNNEYDRFGTASLITRSTNDVMQIRMLLSMGLRTMLYAPIMGLGGVFMALEKSAGTAWIIALACLIILGIVITLFSVALPKFKIMQRLVDKLNLVSRESLSGIMVVRAFSAQEFEEQRFADANKSLAQNNLFVSRVMALMMPVMTLVMNGTSLLIVWAGAHKIAQASMQVGDMMAFIQYAMQIIMSFLLISFMFVMVPRAAVSAKRVEEVLECESSVREPEKAEAFPENAVGEICFNDVSFRYKGAEENVLEHISFTASPGKTTAFIGSTGSGKSTLVNLIPRFYDVTEGSITLDGTDIRRIPLEKLRNAIGFVPQQGVLFSGSIASNLRYGDDMAGESELEQAIDTAQASEFVNKLPQGLEYEINQGGTNVSGGQRQRLAIARALVKKAPVFIFDDTFSALDFKTDSLLRKALKKRTADSTVLIVAQRVSTVMHAEQIIVLDNGAIAGIGTHEQLLKTCETYREIAQSQLTKEELL